MGEYVESTFTNAIDGTRQCRPLGSLFANILLLRSSMSGQSKTNRPAEFEPDGHANIERPTSNAPVNGNC
jgi:hypothetical protein